MCDCTLKKIHAQDLVHYYKQRLFLCMLESDGTDFYIIDHFCCHSGPDCACSQPERDRDRCGPGQVRSHARSTGPLPSSLVQPFH